MRKKQTTLGDVYGEMLKSVKTVVNENAQENINKSKKIPKMSKNAFNDKMNIQKGGPTEADGFHKALNDDYCGCDEEDNEEQYNRISNIEENISISPISQFKFGGGWFNLLSTKLLKLTDMPDSFGPYGVDDLYVMVCCDIMKQKGYNVQQYILEGEIVTENFKYRWNPYQEFLYLINKQNEFRKQAESNLAIEIKKFINKI